VFEITNPNFPKHTTLHADALDWIAFVFPVVPFHFYSDSARGRSVKGQINSMLIKVGVKILGHSKIF
jgi:hypothetical protein